MAQEYIADIKRFGIEDGLVHRWIFDIHQDHQGFIWLATRSGLSRFDGRQFVNWPQEPDGLPKQEIHAMLEDQQGYLWLFNLPNRYHLRFPQSISLLHLSSGKIQSLETHFGPDLPFRLEEIATVAGSPNRVIRISLKDGRLFQYGVDGGFRELASPLSAPIHLAHVDAQEQLWCFPLDLSRLDQTQASDSLPPQRLLSVSPDGQTRIYDLGSLLARDIRFVGEDAAGIAWLLTRESGGKHQLFQLTQEALTRDQIIPALDQAVADIARFWDHKVFYQASQQFFWCKGDDGLFVVDPKQGLIFDFGEQAPEIVDAHVIDIHFDETGIAWLGTMNGLYRVELRPNRFRRYLYQPLRSYTTANGYSCRGMWADSSHLWVSSYRGRLKVDLGTGQAERLPSLQHVSNDGIRTQEGYYPLALTADQHGDLWFGEITLVRHQPDLLRDTLIAWEEGLIPEPEIWSIYFTCDQQIWVGTDHGLGYWDHLSGSLRLAEELNQTMGLGDAVIYGFIKSNQGHVWITSSQGLYAWLPGVGLLNRWWTGGQRPFRIPHDKVFHVHEEADGRLWLGTGGGGLIRLDPEYGSYRAFTVADGLSNQTIYAIYEDQQHQLWMSSDYGIIRFDKVSYQARAYLHGDGITHQEFNRVSHWQALDGTLFFGGLNGVTAFHPQDLVEDSRPFTAPLRITSFQQFEQQAGKLVDRLLALRDARRIVLEPGDRFFQLEFALLAYRFSEKNRYAWKVEGWDQDWTYTKDPTIRVSGLASGRYTLRIKGQGADGQWSSSEIALPLLVKSPIYERTWFWILSTLLIICLGIVWYRMRTYQYKQRQRVLEAMVAERTETIHQQAQRLRQLDQAKNRFFANVSHELRTPLTLMLGPISTLMKRLKDDPKALTYLGMAYQGGQKLQRLITEILDLSRMETSRIEVHPRPIRLLSWIEQLILPFQAAAQQQGVVLQWLHHLPEDPGVLVDAGKLDIILNNLLANALKFTPPGGQIDLTLWEHAGHYSLQVRDTGPGIPPEDLPHIFERFYQASSGGAADRQGVGLGLAICREYANLIGGELRAQSVPGQGATFILELPCLRKTDLPAEDSPPLSHSNGMAPIAPPTNGQHQQATILVVEDHPELRRYLSMTLQPQYRVLQAEHGQVAWEQLEQIGPTGISLVLSDLMMPVMDGFALLERAKSDDRFRHIPWIMLTARAGRDDKLKALRIGVDDYLLKPFEEEELLVRVANLLTRIPERLIREHQPQNGTPPPATSSGLTQSDLDWLKRLETEAGRLLTQFHFTIEELADHMAVSRRQLHRKIKQITGLTPHQYVLELRLQIARERIETQPELPIKVVAHEVGMKDTKHFSQRFKARFGRLPSEWQEFGEG